MSAFKKKKKKDGKVFERKLVEKKRRLRGEILFSKLG